MLKGFLLGVLSVALFVLASFVEHDMLEQLIQIVAAGVAFLCYFVMNKASKN